MIALLKLDNGTQSHNYPELAGLSFRVALSFSASRRAMEAVGLLSHHQPRQDAYTCVFSHEVDDLYNVFSCPPGSYKLSKDDVEKGCPQNTSCPAGNRCLCKPCLVANDDVTVEVVATHDHWEVILLHTLCRSPALFSSSLLSSPFYLVCLCASGLCACVEVSYLLPQNVRERMCMSTQSLLTHASRSTSTPNCTRTKTWIINWRNAKRCSGAGSCISGRSCSISLQTTSSARQKT